MCLGGGRVRAPASLFVDVIARTRGGVFAECLQPRVVLRQTLVAVRTQWLVVQTVPVGEVHYINNTNI